jgi:hypothetical protein
MTTTTTNVDSAGYVAESTTSNDNYVLIKVPSHGTDKFYYQNVTDTTNVTSQIDWSTASEQTMTSFLRIGAVPDDDPAGDSEKAGWDLAQLVVAFMDDTRVRPSDVDTSGTDVTTGTTTVSSLVSGLTNTDVKDAMTAFYGSGKSVTADQANRITESTKLHTRGGWRDHSDGNRITTTRGDKVEIIRGNYKMVVLGRRPDATSSITTDAVSEPVDSVSNSVTTWDASGGHIHDWRMTPGAATEVSWRKNTDNEQTWTVYEETVKGDVDSTYYGEINDVYYGRRVTSTVGYDTSDTANVPAFVTANGLDKVDLPIVTEKTWAKEIYDYTGSSGCYVTKVDEKLYATDHTEYESVSGTKTETTEAGALSSTTTVSGQMTTTTTANGLTESININSVRRTMTGAQGIGMKVGEFWIGNFGEVFLGGMESFKIGGFFECRVGKSIAVNVGLPFSINTYNIAGTFVITGEMASAKLDYFQGGQKVSLAITEGYKDITTGEKTEMSIDKTTLALLTLFV